VPHTRFHPLRKESIRLYDHIIKSTSFPEPPKKYNPELNRFPYFDREECIKELERLTVENGAGIPEYFRMYALEWPTRAVCEFMCPDVPLKVDLGEAFRDTITAPYQFLS
jgi:hypothetical protein